MNVGDSSSDYGMSGDDGSQVSGYVKGSEGHDVRVI
jgi:hypothetical protein